MWVPLDVLASTCLSLGSALLALWVQQRGVPTTFYRFLVAFSLISGAYTAGWALRCSTYLVCGSW